MDYEIDFLPIGEQRREDGTRKNQNFPTTRRLLFRLIVANGWPMLCPCSTRA